jgi:hypothetical protein
MAETRFPDYPPELIDEPKYSAKNGWRSSARVMHADRKDGGVQFAAYDNFDPECLFWGAALHGEFQKSLVEHGY